MGSAFLKLASYTTADGDAVLCFRAAGRGGRIVIASPADVPAPPVYADDDAAACSRTEGNVSPLPPVVSTVGDDQDPGGRTTVSISSYANPAEGVWLCASVSNGSVSIARRVVASAGSRLTLIPDEPGTGDDAVAPSTGTASHLCDPAGTILNLQIAEARVWLGAWAETPTRVHLCVRAQDQVSGGGRLTVDGTITGVQPVLRAGTDPGICTRHVTSFGDSLEVRRGETASTGSVCLKAAGTWTTLTIGTEGESPVPRVEWSPDQ